MQPTQAVLQVGKGRTRFRCPVIGDAKRLVWGYKLMQNQKPGEPLLCLAKPSGTDMG
jgi:hypothetical protein